MSKTIDELFQTPYWIIDILPQQVSAASSGQYFAIEDYYLAPERIADLKRRHIDVVLKLNCYRRISIDEGASHNPDPTDLAKAMRTRYLCILMDDAMIVSEPGESHMTLFNPSAELLALVTTIAAAEGLFVWQPES